MRKVILLALVALAATVLGEEHFSLSSPLEPSKSPCPFPVLERQFELISTATGRADSPPAASADFSTLTGSDQFQVQTDSYMQTRMDVIYGRLEQMDRDGFVFYPARTSDNRIVNAVNAVFKPEVFHIGKISASASIVTAIKRKNPLCLLNPVVLDFSW